MYCYDERENMVHFPNIFAHVLIHTYAEKQKGTSQEYEG